MRGHTNAFEVRVMAETFRDAGFRVEVCDWSDSGYVPPPDTKIAIDIHGNLARWNLSADCHKILHVTGAHWLVQNTQELTRIRAIRDRRGTVLSPVRMVEPTRSAEVADELTVLGNEFTVSSFAFARKKVTRIPISSAYEFDFPRERNMARAKRCFLWMGSYGMALKGLDLVLEAFESMPDFHLTVCGRPEKEPDFYNLYRRQLEGVPHIRFHGWLNMESEEFLRIRETHAAIVYPSASEGGAGSVIHAMHGGLTPICTAEASVDLLDFGVLINESSPEGVRRACREFAAQTDDEALRRCRASYDHVRAVHSREAFRKNYHEFVGDLLDRLSC